MRFSCCTFFVLQSIFVALWSSCMISMLHFFDAVIVHFSLFTCCTLFMLHFLHVALISRCTFSVLHFFLVALFSCCTLFMLHLFMCCTFSMLHFFSFYFKLHFFMLHSFCIALFPCCDLFILYSLHVAPFWVLHFVQVALFHVALIFYCSFFCVALISCCTFCVVTIGGWSRRYVSPFLEISTSILFCYCPHFENFSKTIPFPSYYIDPSYYVKWKFFQGLNHRLNHQLKTRIAYFIYQCKNYSWLILCIMTWVCYFVVEIIFLTVSHTSSLPLTSNAFLYFMVFYQKSFHSFYFDMPILTTLGISFAVFPPDLQVKELI